MKSKIEKPDSMQHYLQLLLASVQSGIQGRENNMVVAFTAALPKEGVSYVVHSFGVELARYTNKRILIVDAQRLQRLSTADYIRMLHCCAETYLPNLWTLPVEEGAADIQDGHHTRLQIQAWQNESEFVLDRIQALRRNFDYILIDCPSLKVSYTAAVLAPNADGVVIVVEVGRTRRDQIQRAQQIVEMANGMLLGLVLNKRRYPVPEWLYKRL